MKINSSANPINFRGISQKFNKAIDGIHQSNFGIKLKTLTQDIFCSQTTFDTKSASILEARDAFIANPVKTVESVIEKHPKGLTPDTFARLSEEEYNALSIQATGTDNYYSHAILDVANDFKSLFDEKFGKKGYTFLSVGRSPAAIGKALEYKGVDVKFLPISNLNSYVIETTSNSGRFFNLIKSLKLKESAEIDKKKIIVADFYGSGESLDTMKKILKQKTKVPAKQLAEFRLNTFLQNRLIRNREIFSHEKKLNYEILLEALGEQDLDAYSHIPQMSPRSFSNINKIVKQPINPQALELQFLMLDKLK